MRCRHVLVVERPRDLSEPTAASVFQADAVDNALGQQRPSASSPALISRARWLQMLLDEVLQFGNRDQSLPPGRLDGADRGDDTAIDRRDADAESLGSLTATVGKTLDIAHLVQEPLPIHESAAVRPDADAISVRGVASVSRSSASYSNSCVG